MEVPDLIQKILDRRGLSQEALSDLLGVDRTTVNKYLKEKRDPGPFPCLLLAALSDTPEEHRFWIKRAKLTPEQTRLLGRSLFPEGVAPIDVFEAELLAWWRGPRTNPMEKSVKPVVEEMLLARTSR